MNDVLIGFGVLQVWAEDEDGHFVTDKKTMNVLVYPEINCKYEDGRWWRRACRLRRSTRGAW